MRHSIVLLMLICMSALADDRNRIRVKVLSDGEQCVVNDQPMRCDLVGNHLRNALRVPVDRIVSIEVEGAQQSEGRGRRVRDILRDAGYSHVMVVAFFTDSQPGR
jgi:hypothetical protein